MKKSLLAVALLTGFAGVASAQNSVTLYGIVDVGYRYTKVDGNSSLNEMRSNASTSRFGLRGSEDLGGGLKGVFKLEQRFDSSNGNASSSSKAFAGDAYLGLESANWGMVTFGRRVAASTDFDSIDPFGDSFGNAAFSYAFISVGPRVNNSINYSTPNFNGFSGALSYSLTGKDDQEAAGSDSNTRYWSLLGQYKSGPLQVIATYDYVDYKDMANTATKVYETSADFWQLGANYDFGVAKAFAAYGNYDAVSGSIFDRNSMTIVCQDAQGRDILESDNESTDAWLLGVTAPIGANGTLMASYYTATDWDIDAFNIGYKHALSKRTDIYTFYSHANNVDMGQDYNNKGSRNEVKDDITSNQFAVGIRHRF